MTPSWINSLVSARVYDLEQPRFAGVLLKFRGATGSPLRPLALV